MPAARVLRIGCISILSAVRFHPTLVNASNACGLSGSAMRVQ